jgi:acetylglutamate kinase
MRKTALVKVSGDLIARWDVLNWIRKLTLTRFTVILIGGGTQINEEFRKRGLKIDFGPLGRRTNTFEERQLAKNVLEVNRAQTQDLLFEHGINAYVEIPVLDIGSVLCHVNGDVYVQASYLGFNDLYILTYESRKEKKAEAFKHLRRVQVVGFPDKLVTA